MQRCLVSLRRIRLISARRSTSHEQDRYPLEKGSCRRAHPHSGRSQPDQPARAYLVVIAQDPEHVWRALEGEVGEGQRRMSLLRQVCPPIPCQRTNTAVELPDFCSRRTPIFYSSVNRERFLCPSPRTGVLQPHRARHGPTYDSRSRWKKTGLASSFLGGVSGVAHYLTRLHQRPG